MIEISIFACYRLLLSLLWVSLLQVSTEAVVLVNKGMWHIEGGWPKDLDCTEQEQTARFIRKVGCVPPCAMLHAILRSNASPGLWAPAHCTDDCLL